MLTAGQAGLQSFLRRVSAEADEAPCFAGVVGDVTREGSHIRRGRAEHAGSCCRYMHALMTACTMHATNSRCAGAIMQICCLSAASKPDGRLVDIKMCGKVAR
jgi:hypothetical protein